MKSYRKVLHVNLPTRRGLKNITQEVRNAIVESGITEGIVLVNAMNITASVFINDDAQLKRTLWQADHASVD